MNPGCRTHTPTHTRTRTPHPTTPTEANIPDESRMPGCDGYRYPVVMTELRLVELSAATTVAVNALSLKPGQEQFIAPTSYAVAGAVVNPATAWQRVVLDGDEVVGFVMANFDPDNELAEFRCGIWRLNVAAHAQGKGVGKALVKQSADKLLRTSMELGGNAPFVVFDDADVDVAADGILTGMTNLNGQWCEGPGKVLAVAGGIAAVLERHEWRILPAPGIDGFFIMRLRKP